MRSVAIAFVLVFPLAAAARADAGLPDNPEPQSSASTSATAEHADRGDVAGTVLDANGDVIQGARVQLSRAGATASVGEAISGANGQFAFSDLAPGTYTVIVTGVGMKKYVSQPIALTPGQVFTVPNVVLSVAGATTSVTVLDGKQASIEQVHVAEQQRVFAVFPNFYSSFDWNAPPMMAKEKYHLALRTVIDPVTFLTVAGIAGAEQYKNVFPSLGGGFEGYAKRYGTTYANQVSSEMLARAVFPSIFHDDPRYFVMGKGSTRDRTFHAISSTFVTRGDNGHSKPNYSEILGKLTAAALSNAYYPAEERGAHLILVNGLGSIGGNIADNIIREFVLNKLTTHAHRNP